MKISVPATLWQCTEMPDNQEGNSFCPSEYSSWCKYWQDGGSQNYQLSVNFPKVIKDLLVPIFLDCETTTFYPNVQRQHKIQMKTLTKLFGKIAQRICSFKDMY